MQFVSEDDLKAKAEESHLTNYAFIMTKVEVSRRKSVNFQKELRFGSIV